MAGAGVACLWPGFFAMNDTHFVPAGNDSAFLVNTLWLTATAAALIDTVLLPGWVWGRFEILPVLSRLVIAVAALVLAIVAGVLVVRLSSISAIAYDTPNGVPLSYSYRPNWLRAWWHAWRYEILLVSLVPAFAAGGAVVGLGAAVAQAADRRKVADPFPRGRTRSHLLGGTMGILILVGLWMVVAALLHVVPAPTTRYFAFGLPLALPLAGLPHNVLVLRDAVRGGGALPDTKTAMRRATICAVALLVAGAAAFLACY